MLVLRITADVGEVHFPDARDAGDVGVQWPPLTVGQDALEIIVDGIEALADAEGVDKAPDGHGDIVVGMIILGRCSRDGVGIGYGRLPVRPGATQDMRKHQDGHRQCADVEIMTNHCCIPLSIFLCSCLNNLYRKPPRTVVEYPALL